MSSGDEWHHSTKQDHHSVRIATWNVLADSYTNPEWYPLAQPEHLAAHGRDDAIVNSVARMLTTCDVICLQEVEQTLAEKLDQIEGCQTHWAQKGKNRPDGCATIVRHDHQLAVIERLEYPDESGHIALIIEIDERRQAQRNIVIANTHLRWTDPESEDPHIGLGQLRALIEHLGGEPLNTNDKIFAIAGDYNDRPGGAAYHELAHNGWQLGELTASALVNSSDSCRLDYIAVRGTPAQEVAGLWRPPVEGDIIPRPDLPSDHIAVVVELGE